MNVVMVQNGRESEKESLLERSGGICEFCGADSGLSVVEVLPEGQDGNAVLACAVCSAQLGGAAALDVNHWRCLHEAVWSDVEAVQVTGWRVLQVLKAEDWAADLLDQVYLDEEVQQWAEALEDEAGEEAVVTKDSNGTVLADGDAVTIIKDLDVKGTQFVAKRGTVVKNISLTGDPELIEGRVNGVKLVLKTCFMKLNQPG